MLCWFASSLLLAFLLVVLTLFKSCLSLFRTGALFLARELEWTTRGASSAHLARSNWTNIIITAASWVDRFPTPGHLLIIFILLSPLLSSCYSFNYCEPSAIHNFTQPIEFLDLFPFHKWSPELSFSSLSQHCNCPQDLIHLLAFLRDDAFWYS